MEQILSVERDTSSEVERYAQVIRERLQEFGLWVLSSLPDDLDLNLDEKLLLDLFLEKQHLVNMQLDGSQDVVWWVKVVGLLYPPLYNRHQEYIKQAYSVVAEDLDANVQASVENLTSAFSLDANSEEVIAWRLEIRYMAQVAHHILRKLKGDLEKSPVRFELKLEYRRQVDKVIKRRKNLLEKGFIGSSEVS